MRRLGPRDVDEVLALEGTCFPAEAWSRAMILTELSKENCAFFGVHMGQALVAYGAISLPFGRAFLGPVGSETWDEPRATLGEGIADILTIGTHPDFRGRGLAKRIVQALEAEAKEQGAQAVMLEVRESNVSAQALYEACGFEAIGRRRRYYHRPEEDALVYKKDLLGISMTSRLHK